MRKPRSSSEPRVTRVRALDGRSAFRINAAWGQVTMLEHGGHISELASRAHGYLNPLWRPPWKTIDPSHYDHKRHTKKYGAPPDGRLLSGIAGHNLAFDHFGPPSEDEVAAGLSTHGEASWRRWTRNSSAKDGELECKVTLRDAQIELVRSVSVHPRFPAVYVEEQAESLTSFDRPMSCAQHVTFGPPFLASGVTRFDLPATCGMVCPESYSSKMLVRANAEFMWPFAPSRQGRPVDLRRTASGSYAQYTAQLIDPNVEIAWLAASNPKAKLLVLYLFRRTDFPWVGNWQESYYRKAAPWNGRVFCRGMEFSTTPFAVPRCDTVARGPVLNEATYQWLPAKGRRQVRYAILLVDLPDNFSGVSSVSVKKQRIDILDHVQGKRTVALALREFLS